MNIAELLGEAMRERMESEENETTSGGPLDEAKVVTLREIAERYNKPCPFVSGSLVTPRKGYNSKGAGNPYVVLEVRQNPISLETSADPTDSTGNAFGRRLDIRVCGFVNGNKTISSFWVESWEYEPWFGTASPGRG